MRYAHVLAYALGRPWAMLPEKLETIAAFLALKADGGTVDPADVRALVETRHARDEQHLEAATQATSGRGGSIAVVPLYGVLTQRGGIDAQTSEALTSTQVFARLLQQLAADPSVKAIVIDVDSPGGEVYGTEEAATVLADLVANSGKPIVAVANAMAASAAYWIASQAEELVVTPSGEVGSIGVRALHVDFSEQLKMEGVKPTFITAGKYKVEGNPYEPLSDEAQAEIQRGVDEYYQTFVNAVARGRSVSAATVRSDFGQGRMLSAQRAVDAGMADRVDTLQGTIDRLASGGYRKPRRKGADLEDPPVLAVAEPAGPSLDTRQRRLRLHSV